jgi:hypothetical protein
MPVHSSVLQLSPLAALRPSPESDEPSSLELQRMQLMREEFENTKAQQARQLELAKLEEGGRMARETMQGQRQIAELDAQKQAAIQKQKLEAYQKFSELNGSGDIEGARALVPMMDSLGMGVDLQGEDELGLPRYAIDMNKGAHAEEEYSKRQQAAAAGDEMGAAGIGYPTNESGPLGAPPGIGSTQDAFTQALAASQQARETGAPARGPDAPDTMGAVPKNVIDLSAQHQNTLKRLKPALGSLVEAYPEEDRESAAKTAAAAEAMGLGTKESVKMFDQLRGGPDAAARGKVAAEAQAAQFAERRTGLTPMEQQRLVNTGFTQARTAGDQLGIKTSLEARKAAQQIQDVLTDNDPNNDRMIGSLMSSMLAEKGAKTEGDIKRALGMDSMSTLDQVMAHIDKMVDGGLNFEQRQAILGVVKNSQEIDRKKLHGFLESIDTETSGDGMDPNVGRGWARYRDTVIPKDVRDEYNEAKRKKAGASASGRTAAVPARHVSGGSPALAERADRGEFDGDGPRVTIPESSRIASTHNNPGNLKFAGQSGAEEGEAAEDGGHWAKFASPDAGLTALREQVEKDADKGLTIRQFVSKYAPPGSNDTETYIKQATAELRAEDGDLLSEVDPYDVVRFVAKKESGTELPSQYDKPMPAADPVFANDPASRAARIAELRRKKEQQ